MGRGITDRRARGTFRSGIATSRPVRGRNRATGREHATYKSVLYRPPIHRFGQGFQRKACVWLDRPRPFPYCHTGLVHRW